MQKQEEAFSVHVATRLTPGILERAIRVAKEKDWSLSQLVRNALVDYMERNNKKAA